jgi:hypothetical protein
MRFLTARRLALLITCFCCLLLLFGMTSNGRTRTAATKWLMIGLGDSLTNGTMNATVNQTNTANAYLQRTADLLAQKVSLVFSQPFIDLNGTRIAPYQQPTNVGIDGEDSFSIDGLEYYKRAGVAQSFVNQSYIANKLFPFQFQNLHDTLLYPTNVLSKHPVTQMQSAEWLLQNWPQENKTLPAIIVYWVGNNDSSTAALGEGGSNPTVLPIPVEQLVPVMPDVAGLIQAGVTQGILSLQPYSTTMIDRNLTLVGDYMNQQAALLQRLVAASSGRETHTFILTLPYYSSVGYTMDSEDIEYYLQKVNPAYSVPPSFKRVAPAGQPITNPLQGDRISLLTFGFMYALASTGYSPNYINNILEVNGVQRDGLVLSEAEQQTIRDRIDGFNASLRTLAGSMGPNTHIVEMGPALNDVLTGQVQLMVGPKQMGRKWIRGSSFSFDGVHPGYVGQSFIANYLVQHINDATGIGAPQYDLPTVLATDPYVDHDNDGFAPGPNYTSPGFTQLLFLFKDPNDSDPNIQAQIPSNVWRLIANAIINEILKNAPAMKAEALKRGLLP